MEYRNKQDISINNNNTELPFSIASEISKEESFVNITMNQDNGLFQVENKQVRQDETPIKNFGQRSLGSPLKNNKIYAKSQQKNNNASSQQKSMRNYNNYNSNTVERIVVNQLKTN